MKEVWGDRAAPRNEEMKAMGCARIGSKMPSPPCSIGRVHMDQAWSVRGIPTMSDQAERSRAEVEWASQTPSSHGRVRSRKRTLEAPRQFRKMWEAARGEASCRRRSRESLKEDKKSLSHPLTQEEEPTGLPSTRRPSVGGCTMTPEENMGGGDPVSRRGSTDDTWEC